MSDIIVYVAISCIAILLAWHLIWKENGEERFRIQKDEFGREEDPRRAARRALESATSYLTRAPPTPWQKVVMWLRGEHW